VGIDSREPAEDVARTLACYHRVIGARVFDHGTLERMAVALDLAASEVSVVNLLSDRAHPCQAFADLLALREALAPRDSSPMALAGRALAYVGDANNVCRSLAKAAVMTGMRFRMAAPPGYQLCEEDVDQITALADTAGRGGTVEVTDDPDLAVAGVDAIYTDVWTSMGQDAERAARVSAFAAYTVDTRLVDLARPDAVVMHCLPAHRGEEISAEVVDGPRSVVWRQAFHRRTAMRGVLCWLVAGDSDPG
jgi:ornithine carbamoyltransferase